MWITTRAYVALEMEEFQKSTARQETREGLLNADLKAAILMREKASRQQGISVLHNPSILSAQGARAAARVHMVTSNAFQMISSMFQMFEVDEGSALQTEAADREMLDESVYSRSSKELSKEFSDPASPYCSKRVRDLLQRKGHDKAWVQKGAGIRG